MEPRTSKSSITTAHSAQQEEIPLVRPARGWNYQYGMTSPGEMLLEEFLKPLGLSQNRLAMSIGVPTTRIGEIVRGKRAITPDTALRLARFFNNSPEFWLNLQQLHDLTNASSFGEKSSKRKCASSSRMRRSDEDTGHFPRKEDCSEVVWHWHTVGMANPEHLAILTRSLEEWTRLRQSPHDGRPDLFEAKLPGAFLRGADLSRADLRRADLYGAILRDADLSNTSHRWEDQGRDRLTGADLSDADLTSADLRGANLNNAKLDRSKLTGATVGLTTFTNVDLSGVIGLETLFHTGPSSIGIDTIYKSKGRIPHVFLRGAGVPENFITYMASLVGTGVEFYSLFISYSTKDQEFAERLHADLQAKGVRCWFAPHNMRGGKKVHEQIEEAIRVYDKLLLILSPASMESEWVKTEISKARKREIQEGKRILFPISLCSFDKLRDWECFDSDAGKDSAREIREYFIPDFSNWKNHDSYRRAFDRLLDDLQGKPTPLST